MSHFLMKTGSCKCSGNICSIVFCYV